VTATEHKIFGVDPYTKRTVYLFDVCIDARKDRKYVERLVRDMGYVKPKIKAGHL
jgi:hypothetical protein